jgi:DNA-directed RNA polymerase specialized sigma24 family protein
VAEVAEELGVPVGTIKSRSYYAKLALRSQLEL